MQYQKPILGLLALQAAILLFLVYRVFTLEAQLVDRAGHSKVPVTQLETIYADSVNADAGPLESGLSVGDVRRIFQEELAVLEQKIDDIPISKEKPSKPSVIPVDPRETARLEALVVSQINTLSTGLDVSATDIANLEQTISKLPSAERTKALGELNKAINAGRIKVRF